MNSAELIAHLSDLASREFNSVKAWVDRFDSPPQYIAWLVEACRALDYQHVLQFLSRDPKNKMARPDFDIMVAGWNALLGLLLPHAGGFQGFPLMESSQNSQTAAMTALHQLGRSALMQQAASMIRHGMAVGQIVGDRIVISMSERASTDHFLDRLDLHKLEDLDGETEEPEPLLRGVLKTTKIEDIDAKMAPLVFAWKTNRGTMVGYGADPDVDRYFLALVSRKTQDWRNEAGIHPDARIGDVSGRDVAAIGLLLASFYLKHIRFIHLGNKIIPRVNFPMSLTIWKPEADLIESLADFTGMERTAVSAAVSLFTLRQSQHQYFLSEPTPFIPMLIEVSNGYFLSPVSSIFRNPFHGIRMMHEWASNGPASSVAEPREDWMRIELYHLFLGNRYHIIDGATRLKREGATVTDIDAAILDWTTGELALFQLKWQDFSTSDIDVQRSKAKNFVTRVDQWARRVRAWIAEFGLEALSKGLQLNSEASRRVSAVRLFAIGRSASRFRSYGYVPDCEEVASCSWAQFVRLRYEIGPAENVFEALHKEIKRENVQRIAVKPIPHEIVVAGQKVLFENLWNTYGEEDE